MKFDPCQAHSKQKAEKYFAELINGREVFDLTKKSYKTIKQNSYLHLIIAWLAIEIGVSLEFAKKHYYKRSANPQLFIREVLDPLTDGIIKELRSTTDLNKEELASSITSFRNWSAQEAGIYLPEANEEDFLKHIAVEEDRFRKQGLL